MITFENGQLIEGEFEQSGAYVEIDGVKHYLQVPKIEGTTPLSAENLNNLQKDLIEYKSIYTILARTMSEPMEINITSYYEVGNDSLKLYLEGQLLTRGVHYEEGKVDGTSVAGDITNKVTLLSWGTLSRDYTLTIFIRGEY